MANVGGYAVYTAKSINYDYEIKHKNTTISHLQDNVETKSNQIATLDSVVKKQNENMLNQKMTIDDSFVKINELEAKAKQLQDDNNKLQQQLNFKKSQEGSDVGGRQLTVTATAYTAFCSEGCTGRTATGINVSNSIYYNGYRVIAVDTSVIPLNSLVKVETATQSFTAMAIDTGGGIHGNRIDVLVGSTSEAFKFGKQQVKLTVLREGDNNVTN